MIMLENPQLKIVPYFKDDTMENAKTFKLIRESTVGGIDFEICIGDMETCMYYMCEINKGKKKGS